MIKYKKGKDNVVVDALSQRHALITIMDAKILGFEGIKDQYAEDPGLEECFREHGKGVYKKFFPPEGFLFKGHRLSIPNGSLRELLVREAHSGELMGHFRANKSLVMLRNHLYWPKMRGIIEGYCAICLTYKKAKSRVQP